MYQEALEIELKNSGILFRREMPLKVYYKGHLLQQEFFADFVCYDKIIVELKAVSVLTNTHRAQVSNYLKATNFDLGLLVNFGASELQIERLFNYHKNRTRAY